MKYKSIVMSVKNALDMYYDLGDQDPAEVLDYIAEDFCGGDQNLFMKLV
jgi:hypothetical protein